jgi:hypothetical protein
MVEGTGSPGRVDRGQTGTRTTGGFESAGKGAGALGGRIRAGLGHFSDRTGTIPDEGPGAKRPRSSKVAGSNHSSYGEVPVPAPRIVWAGFNRSSRELLSPPRRGRQRLGHAWTPPSTGVKPESESRPTAGREILSPPPSSMREAARRSSSGSGLGTPLPDSDRPTAPILSDSDSINTLRPCLFHDHGAERNSRTDPTLR